MQVVVTIDAEPDNAWGNRLNPSVANVRELLRLQSVLDKYGAKATCLATYRVISSPEGTEVLQELVSKGAEIGAHLHPWESPPFMESGIDTRYHTYPHELPVDVFEQKLGCLTEGIAKRFSPPTSYRGGRWGIAPEHLQILERMGFEVDTTVTPLVNWQEALGIPRSLGGHGGVDFRSAPRHPYHPDYADITCEGEARIVEVPLTVAFTRRVPLWLRRRYNSLPVLMIRLLRKLNLVRPVWAMAERESTGNLERMLSVAIREGASVVNIGLHSSELMPGGSPHTKTTAEVEGVFGRLGAMLEALAARHKCSFATLTDAASRFQALGGPPPSS